MIKSIGWGFGQCNMRCKDCYHASGQHAPEYSYDKLIGIADKICPTIESINYGTGELLYNPCTVPLVEYISDRYPLVKQAVTTNGFTVSLMPKEIVKKAFHDVDVSIDFPDPERQKEFRRHPKSWDWAIESLKICRALGVESSIVTCVTSQTSDKDILKLLELASKFNTSWRCSWFRNTGRGKEKYRLSSDRFWKIIRLLAKETVFESMPDPLLVGILGKTEQKGCPCGILSCRIQTNLEVTPCVFLKGRDWSSGSLLEMGLGRIYISEPFNRIRTREPELCLGCEFWEACRGGCASRAYLHSGGLNQPDDYCPVINNLPQELWQGIEINILNKTEKVHGGYLCTLITKPK